MHGAAEHALEGRLVFEDLLPPGLGRLGRKGEVIDGMGADQMTGPLRQRADFISSQDTMRGTRKALGAAP